ncbi:MAG: hypothetical protein ISS82_03180 [Nanoarchaeota archaeon]|nr:hypothetical protein [Nanoarchaeota archaeon]
MEQMAQPSFDVMGRVRIIESKYIDLRERLLVVNQNMVQGYKNLSTEIKLLNEDIRELKSDLFEIKESMHKIVHELQFFASKNDLKVLEKYINMWNPLNFVTEEEVIELIKKQRGGKSTRKKRK